MPSSKKKKKRSKKAQHGRRSSNNSDTARPSPSLRESDFMHFELMRSLTDGDEEKFVHMLSEVPWFPINHQHSSCGTPLLFLACAMDEPMAVRAILDRNGVDVNLPTQVAVAGPDAPSIPSGVAPFYIACEVGALECVKLLSRAPGIDMNFRSPDGTPPFVIAAHNGHAHVVKYLLSEIEDGRIDYNAISIGEGATRTAFLAAIENGKISTTKLLLADERINHHQVTKYGRNAMDLACFSGSRTLIKLLEDHGLERATDAKKSSMVGQLLQDDGTMTKRRARAEDHAAGDTLECSYCHKSGNKDTLQRCLRCLSVWYCGKECQHAHWRMPEPDGHKYCCFEAKEKKISDEDLSAAFG